MSKIYEDHNNVEVIVEKSGHKYSIYHHTSNKDFHKFTDLQKIEFQNGPTKEVGINGIQNEHLIAILINRIGYLDSQFPCEENKQCLTHLQIAMDYLEQRTRDRLARQVEGENKL